MKWRMEFRMSTLYSASWSAKVDGRVYVTRRNVEAGIGCFG